MQLSKMHNLRSFSNAEIPQSYAFFKALEIRLPLHGFDLGSNLHLTPDDLDQSLTCCFLLSYRSSLGSYQGHLRWRTTWNDDNGGWIIWTTGSHYNSSRFGLHGGLSQAAKVILII